MFLLIYCKSFSNLKNADKIKAEEHSFERRLFQNLWLLGALIKPMFIAETCKDYARDHIYLKFSLFMLR